MFTLHWGYSWVWYLNSFEDSTFLCLLVSTLTTEMKAAKVSSLKYLNHVMRKAAFCIYKNKGPDQLHGNSSTEQRLWSRYINSKIPVYFLNLQFKASSYLLPLKGPVCFWHGQDTKDRFSHNIAQFKDNFHQLSLKYTHKNCINRSIWTLFIFLLHVNWVRSWENLSLGFLTRSNTNQAVQLEA